MANLADTVGQTVTMKELAGLIQTKLEEKDVKVSKDAIGKVLSVIGSVVGEELAKGQRISIQNFVTLVPSLRKSREAFNIVSGTKMVIPDTMVVNAKLGSGVKDAVKVASPDLVPYFAD